LTEERPGDETLEVALRIAGAEVFAFAIRARSKTRNWIVFAIVAAAIIAQIAVILGPDLAALMREGQAPP